MTTAAPTAGELPAPTAHEDPPVPTTPNAAAQLVESAQHHVDAWADTGDGYRNLGKRHVLQCLWCEKYFGGRTKADALVNYRKHEKEMSDVAHRAHAAQFDADRRA
ncbi:hypothetical protein [Rhodococcus qingshengii]|uniref:hypothetical protein n=1 Tax=Rhodococcus qingshengii TaxID=334542 RepID=UPI0021B1474C|nr:hypothetical protein [Rhodococcus qingshengii]MCT6735446.1 hypothetical protein [Rhodococcus qingshengii]